jgi:beta-galactosidase
MRERSNILGRTGILFIFLGLQTITLNLQAQSREVYSLNDGWEYTLNDLDIENVNTADIHWDEVGIPHTWNDKDIQSGEKVNYGTAWYQGDLRIDGDISDKEYFIRFEGVGQYAELYINSKYVGEHLGSYSAFAFNITNFLLGDTINRIQVKVNNELNDSYPKDNFLFGIYGGIYRDVNLIITDKVHIGITDHASSGIYIHPKEINSNEAILKVTSMLKNDGKNKQLITLIHSLIGENDEIVAEVRKEELLYPGGLVPVSAVLKVDKPRLWNGRKDPFLYRLQTRVMLEGRVLDEITQNYGIRYFDVDPEKGFILNGEPYRLYGVCRHQEWQDLGNALLPKHHRIDMQLIDELGATSIRLAHYQQAEYIYALADSLGILVWAEIPFVNGYKENADGNAKQQMAELIKQNFNHPSIFVWGVHNEVIKGEVVQPPVYLTRELHNLSKVLDPNRYTVAVSNIWWVYDHPIHENTDLQGFNQYTGWYGGKPSELKKWIDNYHEVKPDIRFSVSEYGAGGNINHQSSDITTVPKPTGQFFPEAYHTYYHETTWTAIASSPFIWASYVWNMFDFSVPEWDRGGIKGRNHKGLITYNRKTRKDAFYWYKANWSDEAVLYLCGHRNNKVTSNTLTFKAYCNFGTPVLLIEGVSYGKMQNGINPIQYILDDIILEKGEYIIEVRASSDDLQYKNGFILEIID